MDLREERIAQIKRRTQLLSDPEYVKRARQAQKRELVVVVAAICLLCAASATFLLLSRVI
jgi:hypothetical protein